MTDAQIALVKRTWKLFRDVDPVTVGEVFYGKLFLEIPHAKHLFTRPVDQQSRKLIEMINIVIGRLERLEELTEDIRQLALRHVGYGVKASHYKSVGNALLWTLEQGLGKDWNEEVKDAWAACYATLSETMIKAAYPVK